ncbi:winged helix-turn-helix transcriptional regulator [Clostridium sp. Sa3CUN1]|uniref:Winged helix-turn-helix transcriptional regulator n=1 Tax=Clostridium gallinarum TaxID=2762246 RepID=A0ABR8Q510_9CLOT|nr:metalloregulator ArsR/SmtB family transcription factor [Clostridium gallinarum]MBD7915494.1 winged helix-turn-helix transcriptional regulator [Clostridium gallinarum]
MDYIDTPNMLLEAIAYLCRKASGNTLDQLDKKIKEKKLEYNDSFKKTFSKLKNFNNLIDKNINISNEILNKFFSNIEGFSFNTIGSTSIAFLLLYNALEEFNEDIDILINNIKTLSHDKIAYNITEALDISDNYSHDESITESDFIDIILSLSIPAESKIIILDTYRNYEKFLDEISIPLKKVITILNKEKNNFIDILSPFNIYISNIGCESFFKKISKLKPLDTVNYYLRPFIFGMDTTLTSNKTTDIVHIYCGILRKDLLEMLNKEISYVDDVYKAYNLLGDRTRFDILCYIRKNKAYGVELSNHFNLSRNTIHHHMSKLINSGLITCTTDGKRVYYSLDTDAFEKLIVNQKKLFLQ